LTGVPVDTYDEVFKVCFGDVKKEVVEHVWSDVLTEEEVPAN
jgi:Lon-like ATP-dependent protease